MPKNKNSRQRVETVSGADFLTVINAGTSGVVNIRPSTFTRALALADNFNMYRFVSVEVCFLAATTASVTCGYVPGVLDNGPTSTAGVANLEASNVSFGEQTVPSFVRLRRNLLVRDGASKWWKTIASANVEDWEEIQGQVYFAANASATELAFFRWTMELTGWATAASTPLPRPEPVSSDRSAAPETKLEGVPTGVLVGQGIAYPKGFCKRGLGNIN